MPGLFPSRLKNMNVLLVSARFPWPSYTGDRMRASIWIEALAPHATVALVAPEGDVPSRGSSFHFFAARRSFIAGVRGVIAVITRRLPLQTLLAAPFAWPAAIERAHRELGPFDATVVILSRCEPWVRESLLPGASRNSSKSIRILDAIDSLRRNTAERASASMLTRPIWRHEERRVAREEKRLGQLYDHVVVVSDDETSEFGGAAITIANSVAIEPLDASVARNIDFGFWGRLAYFANADAAQWLLQEIVPALRELEPAASIVIGGADASRTLRRAAERAGVELRSPLENVAQFARTVRVAIMPIRYGSGQLSKLLEAGEAGCAIVTTAQAMRGLPHLAPHVSVENDAKSIAAAAAKLHRSENQRATMGAALRSAVEQHHSRKHVLDAMARLAGVTTSAAVNE
jgi:glycosyltransferase involved in cell wall biosynthesis